MERIGNLWDRWAALSLAAFQLALDVSPDRVARAFLLYDLTGLPNWTAAVRSTRPR